MDLNELLASLTADTPEPEPRNNFEKYLYDFVEHYEGKVNLDDMFFFANILNTFEQLEPEIEFISKTGEYYSKKYSLPTLCCLTLMQNAPENKCPPEIRKLFDNYSVSSKDVTEALRDFDTQLIAITKILLRTLEKIMIEEETAVA